ncbi:TetR/AcrR family transcriptional regulator [Agromyces mediolanus]|uniref:TetR/AcrR family transcriptional regulator n=1 Tax=Agromyces mediolanus TaxID=41986 RepID=UPI00203B0FA9|nr:TetR/AcrR family transcriptional regulator [Agromyces mediolanus]MCM3658314.1 TetR/AcrR family transcriptional regulator [Agromyces mediolanus]
MARTSTTKRQILDAALELAATKGITGTTMDEVAERAGVAKGSLYYNFSSKDLLFEALLKERVGALAESLRRAKGERRGQEAIEALVAELLDVIAANSALAKLMAAEIFRTDRAWQETLFALRHEALAVFAEAIAEASGPAGAGRTDASAAAAAGLRASAVFGAVLMAGLEWLVFEPDRDRAEVAAAILATLRPA